MHGFPQWSETITFLNVRQNLISKISDQFYGLLIESQVKWLDLAENKMETISTKMMELKGLEQLWLSGNPLHCACEITWMTNWLNNFLLSLDKHVVMDFWNVTCSNHDIHGVPIFSLSKVDLGCFPPTWTTGQKITVSLGAVAALVFIILGVVLSRRSREVKFVFYYYLNLDTIPKDDETEIVGNKEYDAFFCYWYVYTSLQDFH